MTARPAVESPDRLWFLVAEFGERARANHAVVERAILDFAESETAMHRTAREGLANPASPATAMRASELYRARLEASEPEAPSLVERSAWLAKVHDLVLVEDCDGDRRESRRPLAPAALDGALEVWWSLLVLPGDVPRMRAYLPMAGSCRASEYLADVRAELPVP